MASSLTDARRTEPTQGSAWRIKVLFDGDCPLCSREVAWLRRRDRHARIAFEDIAAPDFDPRAYGTDLDTLMGRIHGVLPDGSLIEGMEVFRRLYGAVGLGWLLAPSRWPLLRPLFEAAYRSFARNRLRLTGRAAAHCDGDRCAVAPGTLAVRTKPAPER